MKKNLQKKMTKIIMALFAFFFLTTGTSLAAGGEWTWMSGDNQTDQIGTYGTKGTAEFDNIPGGRSSSTSWTDSSGDLWLFGGYDYYDSGGDLNDLWRYDLNTNMWTWMSGDNESEQIGTYGIKGTADLDNMPGARFGSISWTDSGDLWLFGGWGYDSNGSSGYLNDLWRYDPDTNMWTWMSGDNETYQVGTYGTKGTPDLDNIPDARHSSISWTDSNGDLWLFGGYAGNGHQNDLWHYDPDTNMWTWMSGDNDTYQVGTYGTKGTADSDNIPGARDTSISWTDSNGDLWLFGGNDDNGKRNDLWRYDPDTNMWTWMSGDNETNQIGTYGTKGTADLDNIPGARISSISWTDSNGDLWLFGGRGMAGEGKEGALNDLWRYDPDTNMWTWMSGDDDTFQVGTYGTKGTADLDNIPGARDSSISWTDSNGDLWLFGGDGLDIEGSSGDLNDLWRYELPECIDDADCHDGECVENVCVDYECIDDADCTDGECVENVCVDYECMDDSDCLDGLYCNGAEECIAWECVAGIKPCDASERCDEASDQCLCDVEWDLDADCDVDKEDKKLLKLRQKAEKTALKVKQKAEKTAMKAAIGFPEVCGMGWDLDGDCDVDKEDSTLLKIQQKHEKTLLKNKHKAEKTAMKAAL